MDARHCGDGIPRTAAPETPPATVRDGLRNCPLRALKLFHEPTGEELELVQSLKRRERRLGAGESLIHEGQTDAPLYTLLQGWAFRYKTLSDGRRQILSFLLAGTSSAFSKRWATSLPTGWRRSPTQCSVYSSAMRSGSCTDAAR